MIEIMNVENIKCSSKYIQIAEEEALETGKDFTECLIELLNEASYINEEAD